MHLLSDIITYVRRIIKSPSDASISDDLIIDYINRFYISDVDARMQLFDMKTKYQFQTVPGVDQYNMPLYDVQIESGNQTIASFPVYQGFLDNVYINGIPVSFHTQKNTFVNYWTTSCQNLQAVAIADGGSQYTIQLPFLGNFTNSINQPPSGLLRGHVDITGIIATGLNIDPPVASTLNLAIPTTSVYSSIYFIATDVTGANAIVCDSGQFLSGNINYGLLMRPGNAPLGNLALNGGYSTSLNTINYQTGQATFTFTDQTGGTLAIPAGQNISAQGYFYAPGLPRSVLFYNNILTLRTIPDRQYLVELDAYLTPAAFLITSNAIPFGYMAEYLARGASRKILSDTGDMEQFQFYEPLFREQELLVWKRSQRQWTATRTPTLYSQGHGMHGSGNGYYGGNLL